MNIKKLSVLMVVVLMMVSLFAGCKPDGGGETTKTTAKPGGETSAPTEGEAKYYDDAIVNMNGYEFTHASPYVNGKQTDKSTLLEKLLYQRAAEVEKDYNAKIKFLTVYPDQSYVMPKILAGEKIADIVDMHIDMILPAIMNNHVIPLNDIENFHLDDARWVKAYSNLTTVRGKTYGVNFTRPPEARGAMYFNKEILKNSGVTEDIEQLALDGEWTFDKFKEILVKTTKDNNNDGVVDVYGMVPWNIQWAPFLFTLANNAPIIADKDGKYVANMTSPEFIAALNYYDDLVNVSKVVKIYDHYRSEETFNSVEPDPIGDFIKGDAAFLLTETWVGNQRLKPVSDKLEYGIVPVPKGPNATDYQGWSRHARVYTITSTNKDLDKVIPLFNALARPVEGYEGEEWWQEDIAFEYFGDKDEAANVKSSKVYKLILDSSTTDMGTTMDSVEGGIRHILLWSILWQGQTVTSAMTEQEGIHDANIDAVMNKT